MLKDWQFNVLFFVGVGGAILILLGPEVGMDLIGENPMAATGVGAILTYVLAQKKAQSSKKNGDHPNPPPEDKPPEEVEKDGSH